MRVRWNVGHLGYKLFHTKGTTFDSYILWFKTVLNDLFKRFFFATHFVCHSEIIGERVKVSLSMNISVIECNISLFVQM